MSMNIVLITGGFDPVHSGHIDYINAAKELGDILIVGLNSNNWLAAKKGRAFMSWEERAAVISNLKAVDRVINFNDADRTARDAIRKARALFPNDHIIFANGGDRNNANVPELDVDDNNITFRFGVGGTAKKNSSSWILDNWEKKRTDRAWGNWSVLENYSNVKVKELSVNPGQFLSMQRHQHRQEFWFVAEGTATVNRLAPSSDIESTTIEQYDHTWIGPKEWHQLGNSSDQLLKIVEIQWGDKCEEEDIERK